MRVWEANQGPLEEQQVLKKKLCVWVFCLLLSVPQEHACICRGQKKALDALKVEL